MKIKLQIYDLLIRINKIIKMIVPTCMQFPCRPSIHPAAAYIVAVVVPNVPDNVH